MATGTYKFYLSKAKNIYKGKESELIRTFAIEKQAQRELHPTFGPLVMINGLGSVFSSWILLKLFCSAQVSVESVNDI